MLGASSVELTPTNSDGPFPLLGPVGAIRVAARAGSASGLGSNEAPSASFELDNTDNFASELIGSPLRALASIYDDDNALAFAGLVASIRFGKTIELTLES